MPHVIRLAAGEEQCPSPESEGFFESGLAQGVIKFPETGFQLNIFSSFFKIFSGNIPADTCIHRL